MAPDGHRPFWQLLDSSAQTEIERLGRLVGFPRGSSILQQYDRTDHLLVLRHGCVKVVVESDTGYRAILAIRGPGDLVGEQAGLDGGSRSASLYALTEVTALVVPLSRFGTVKESRPAVARALQQVLSGRLREADRHRTDTGSGHVRTRLAGLLLKLADQYGHPTDGGTVRITVALSQDDLAGLVLSSRRTVVRLLEQWREAGWLRTGRCLIELHDLAELEKLARADPSVGLSRPEADP
ncbi:Crp/Fnr family transcriptional regulator [Kitasatospora purpeofusca]|uniref:Crp/Fnr family transcriptional regulator n=1 Tax=Kitasatospora purpeofusca TaxID=67352 RepID=UPI0035E14A96